MKGSGRVPRSKLNRHLYLRRGVWWTRIERTDAFGHGAIEAAYALNRRQIHDI